MLEKMGVQLLIRINNNNIDNTQQINYCIDRFVEEIKPIQKQIADLLVSQDKEESKSKKGQKNRYISVLNKRNAQIKIQNSMIIKLNDAENDFKKIKFKNNQIIIKLQRQIITKQQQIIAQQNPAAPEPRPYVPQPKTDK